MTELSLLWPDGQPTPTWPVPQETIRDLELEAIVQAMCSHSRYQKAVRNTLFHLCLAEETIRYRQTVLTDLQLQTPLAEKLEELLPLLDELTQFTYRQIGRGNSLQEVVARVRELELLVAVVQQLDQAFATVSSPLGSAGLSALRDRIFSLREDQQFQEMAGELPVLLEALRSNASITIGVNLDHDLRPEAAVLLSVNQERFTDSSLLNRLLGKGVQQSKGIAPIHRPPVISEFNSPGASGRQKRLSPLMTPLFKDLAKVLEKISEPIAQELKKYIQLNGRFLADLHHEIIFYIQALNLVKKLEAAGMPLTYPEIAPAEERRCQVKSAYNLQLALREMRVHSGKAADPHVVTNDIVFDGEGRIAILTGPNRGGKTTYMQGVGLVQVLAQVGMLVPGEEAILSPVDGIYTHYPVEEQLELGTGRFGDEAQRLRSIFEKVTRYSLVLLNESLSTTGVDEGLYLARVLVRSLRRIGLRAVFTTHLHELAAVAEEINNQTPGDSAVFSLVASRPEGVPGDDQVYSYYVQSGPPLGRSYAEHIAARYGITDEQLQTLLEERNLLSDAR
jgi:DNA mismatch repair ATPase MutS